MPNTFNDGEKLDSVRTKLNNAISKTDGELKITLNSGSFSAPGAAFLNDPNTGFYSPDPDTVGIATAGEGRVLVDAAGTMLLAGGTGVTAAADAEGVASGTYTPSPVGGNFKTITNGGAFTLAAPTAPGDYTMILQITNTASAGAVTLTGYTKVSGESFNTTDGAVFRVYITKIGAVITAAVEVI